MINNPVGWFEIYVQDMQRAKMFYEQVFEVQLTKLEGDSEIEMWTFPMHEKGTGAGGGLIKMADCPSGGNSTVVYFNCEDCAVEASRVSAGGGKISKEKFSIDPHGFIAMVIDTEGNMLGLHSMS